MGKRVLTNRIKKAGKQSGLKLIELLLAGLELLLILLILCLIIEKTRYRSFRLDSLSGNMPNRNVPATDSALLAKKEFRIPILMYHYVENVQDENDTIRIALTIPPDVFENQIKTLKNNGYTFLTAGELGEILHGRKKMPNKPVLVTIDDGHWDVYTDILPILRKYRIKATAYIVPGLVGGSDFLSAKQLQEVINSGLFEIGAHSMYHYSLPQLSYEEKRFEINESKLSLERMFGIRVSSFAYPNGEFDDATLTMVNEAGFTTAVSTIPGITQSQKNVYTLYRLRPGKRTGIDLISWLNQDIFQEYAGNIVAK